LIADLEKGGIYPTPAEATQEADGADAEEEWTDDDGAEPDDIEMGV
jgi:hypothetical protein